MVNMRAGASSTITDWLYAPGIRDAVSGSAGLVAIFPRSFAHQVHELSQSVSASMPTRRPWVLIPGPFVSVSRLAHQRHHSGRSLFGSAEIEPCRRCAFLHSSSPGLRCACADAPYRDNPQSCCDNSIRRSRRPRFLGYTLVRPQVTPVSPYRCVVIGFTQPSAWHIEAPPTLAGSAND